MPYWSRASFKVAVGAGHVATVEQLLQRLVLGGLRVCILCISDSAAAVAEQSAQLKRLQLPGGVQILTAIPATLELSLRCAGLRQLYVLNVCTHQRGKAAQSIIVGSLS